MHAFLSGKLVSRDAIDSITTSRGPAADFYGFTLLAFADYSQGMWTNEPQSVSHSMGYYGFFPWVDQSDPDPANHFFGIIAVNYRVYFPWAMGLLLATLVPVFVIAILLFGSCCTAFRLQESHYRSRLCCGPREDVTFVATTHKTKSIGARKYTPAWLCRGFYRRPDCCYKVNLLHSEGCGQNVAQTRR